jgi:hypothetical protein
MSDKIVSLDKVRQDAKDRDIREFIEMCKANAPEFTLIEDLEPSPAQVLVLHKNAE